MGIRGEISAVWLSRFRTWEEASLSPVAWVRLLVWNSLSAEDREIRGSRKRALVALVVETADL